MMHNPTGQSGGRMRARQTKPRRGRRCHMRNRCHRVGDAARMSATSTSGMSYTGHQR